MHSEDRVWRERGLRAAVLAGDEQAWRTWYNESFDDLYAYARWRSGGLRDLADEAVQVTWLTAVRRIRTFDPARGPFASWLRGIAANVLRNLLRQHRRCGPRAVAVRDVPTDGRAQEESTARGVRVAETLAALPERYEAVLRAKYLEQRCVTDIAAAWGETPKAVESLLTRARQAFREAYEKEE